MNKIKLFISCIIGTMLEWYDFAVFGLLAPVLAKIFFPFTSHINALLISFLIFATGFAMRPIGGIFFGHIGDKYGRKKAIVPAIMLMTIATVCIGLLPAKANYFTVTALVFCRLAQGFAVSGEYSGIITLISEQTTSRKSFFYQGFAAAGAMSGFLLGSLVYKLALHNILAIASWRIPFLFSFLLGFVGLYLRLKITIDEIYIIKKYIPLKKLLNKKYYHALVFGLLYIMSATTGFYFVNIYMPSYLHHLGFKPQDYLNINLFNALITCICALFFGFLARYKDIIKMIKIYLSGYLFLPIILMFLITKLHATPYLLLLLAVVHGIGMPLCCGVISLLFSREIRYTAVAFITNISVCIFGGSTPFICWLSVKITGWYFAPAIYVSFTAIISLIAIIYYKSQILAIINNKDKN